MAAAKSTIATSDLLVGSRVRACTRTDRKLRSTSVTKAALPGSRKRGSPNGAEGCAGTSSVNVAAAAARKRWDPGGASRYPAGVGYQLTSIRGGGRAVRFRSWRGCSDWMWLDLLKRSAASAASARHTASARVCTQCTVCAQACRSREQSILHTHRQGSMARIPHATSAPYKHRQPPSDSCMIQLSAII